MNKTRIAFIVVVLITLMIPVTVQAAGTFYCSALRSTGGTGTYTDPWACSTDAQLNDIIYNRICDRYGGGHLYRIFSGQYVYYRIEYVFENNENVCRVTYQSEYPGYPPDTGPELTAPLIIGIAAGAGALLLVGGLFVRRRRSQAI